MYPVRRPFYAVSLLASSEYGLSRTPYGVHEFPPLALNDTLANLTDRFVSFQQHLRNGLSARCDALNVERLVRLQLPPLPL